MQAATTIQETLAPQEALEQLAGKEPEEMPPRQQIDDEVAFRILKSLESIQTTLEKKNGNGGMKANIVGWIGVALILLSHAYYTGRIVRDAEAAREEIQRVEREREQAASAQRDKDQAQEYMIQQLRLAVERKGIRTGN